MTTLVRYLRQHPGCTEVPDYLRVVDGAFPGGIPMRDPIVQKAIAENLKHLPYRDGVGSGERPVTEEVVKRAKAIAHQASLPPPSPVSAHQAPRVPPRERLCAYMRELMQATAITLRKMNPTPAEWFRIGCVHVFGFVCAALHAFWPVAALALGCWLYVWAPALARQAHHWRDRAARSRRKRQRRAKRPQPPPQAPYSWHAQRALSEHRVREVDRLTQEAVRVEKVTLWVCIVLFAGLAGVTVAIGA